MRPTNKYTTRQYAQYPDRYTSTFTRPNYHIATADFSRKIDAKSPSHLFAPIAKNGHWSEDAKVWRSVLRDGKVPIAVNDMQVVARAWLNSQIQAWQKNVNITTKRANLKGDDWNIVQLTHSKSPLKEFSDTAFRER